MLLSLFLLVETVIEPPDVLVIGFPCEELSSTEGS